MREYSLERLAKEEAYTWHPIMIMNECMKENEIQDGVRL